MRKCRLLLSAAAALPPPPCAPTHAALLRAVLSKLPPGTPVSLPQLKSMAGVYSNDLCGCTLKELTAASPGGWASALDSVLGVAATAPPPDSLPVPPSTWVDPRPAPPRHTRCLGESFPIPDCVTYVTNDADAIDDLVGECGFEAAPHLGLDLEWTPTFVRGQPSVIAMLQLASTSHCLLLRVGQMRQLQPQPPAAESSALPPLLPPRLSALLASPTALKVGRGVRDDARQIRAQLGCEVAGVTELPYKRKGLKTLAQTVAKLHPPKAQWNTHWDARELDDTALRYAAWDAVAAAAIAAKLPPAHVAGGKKKQRGARPGPPST